MPAMADAAHILLHLPDEPVRESWNCKKLHSAT
jgi:hypothetical protein